MSRRQSLAPPETFQISSDTQWEEVGLEAEEGMEAEEEEAPAGRSTSPKTRKPLMNKVGKPRMAVRRTTPSSSSAPATPDPQMVANMAMELAQKMMSAQGLLNKQGQDPQMPDELYEEDFEEQRGAKTRGKGSSSQREPSVKKKNTSQKAQRQAALTGDLANFPTLSCRFSADVTFNIMASLQAQMLVFKWKTLLLMLRVKQAVEKERGQSGRPLKWKRNPRWMMALHGRQLAALWGHLGAARQLCFNPKTWWLADVDRE